MSSKAKRVKDQIVEQRITTVVQVLTIMQNEAEKMRKNIDVFFKVAKHGRKKDVQASDEE